MQISELSNKLEIPSSTLRYYESLGLIKSSRLANDYRNYEEAEINKLQFIIGMAKMGFTLNEIGTLLGVPNGSTDSCSQFGQAANKALTRVKSQIKELLGYKSVLEKALNSCSPSGSICDYLH